MGRRSLNPCPPPGMWLSVLSGVFCLSRLPVALLYDDPGPQFLDHCLCLLSKTIRSRLHLALLTLWPRMSYQPLPQVFEGTSVPNSIDSTSVLVKRCPPTLSLPPHPLHSGHQVQPAKGVARTSYILTVHLTPWVTKELRTG